MAQNELTLRRTQLIGTYGPGAIVTDRNGVSWILQGIDHWYCDQSDPVECAKEQDFEPWIMREPRLEKLLGIDHIRIPPDYRRPRNGASGNSLGGEGRRIPSSIFPRLWVCRSAAKDSDSICGILRISAVMSNLDGRMKCPDHGGTMRQMRVAVVCGNGHLDDFPVVNWVHRRKETQACSIESIRLEVSRKQSGLAGLVLRCLKCNKIRSLDRISMTTNGGESSYLRDNCYSENEPFNCTSQQPWLSKQLGSAEQCDLPPVGTYLGASNLYFSDIQSALSLPSEDVDVRLFSLIQDLPAAERQFLKFCEIEQVRARSSADIRYQFFGDFSDESLSRCLDALKRDAPIEAVEDQESEIRDREFDVLNSQSIPRDLLPQAILSSEAPPWPLPLGRVVALGNVVVTRVLAGFTRRTPPAEMSLRGTPSRKNLSTDVQNWLPGVRNAGEGILVVLDSQLLSKWESGATVTHRTNWIHKLLDKPMHSRIAMYKDVLPRLILAHTLSHSLIRAINLEFGISTASLKERLYANANGAATLITTSDGDEVGSLSGLLQVIDSASMRHVISRALEESRYCAFDPACSEEQLHSADQTHLNGAGCFSCIYLPETSCEFMNQLLDRILLNDYAAMAQT